ISGLEHLMKNYPNLGFDLKWKLAFDANLNNFECFQTIKEASEENNLKFIEMEHPFTFGEDFGYLTQKYNGAMFGLGAGEQTPELHNPDYDFPDELHEKGVGMFFSIAKRVLLAPEMEQNMGSTGSPKQLFQQ
ncbi:MAG TPA: M20/M25/M40 family metallo-hydrolase, partial [Salinimicrobium sp.]|nr:M20/M25/M40 family metallo-hydrolase [Salinimicrobium sp.]